MEPTRLSDADNQKILQTLASLGFKTISGEELFFYYGEPSEEYLEKLSGGSEKDKAFERLYRFGKIPGWITNRSHFDNGVIRTFISESMTKEQSKYFGYPVETIKVSRAAHELVHKVLYDFSRKIGDGASELLADFVSSKVIASEYVFVKNLIDREKVPGFDEDLYDLAKTAAFKAFDQVLESIDETLAEKIKNNPAENPLTQFNNRLQTIGLDADNGETIKKVFWDVLDRFFEKNIRGLENAPRTLNEFGARIINQFCTNAEEKVREIIRNENAKAT